MHAFTLYCKVLSMNSVREILLAALLVGVAADALLRDGFQGVGFPLWVAVVLMATLALGRRDRRAVSAQAHGWLVAAVLAATGLAWRAPSELSALDFLATLLALGLAAISIGQREAAPIGAPFRVLVWAGGRVLRDVFVGALPLAFHGLLAPGARDPASRRGWPLLRTMLIVVSLLAVFGSLLRAADPLFASLLAIPDFDFGEVMVHLFLIGFFAWVFAGWSRGAFISSATASRPPARLPLSLGMTDMTAALAALDALFTVFILAQLGWLFGGERFLQARTGLTAAQYARAGFFQMVLVVALGVPLLMATRALADSGEATRRRHTRLAMPMIGLLLAMIASAALRMRLYVNYFGLTTDRFYTLAIMAWLGVVLIWLAATTLRGRERHFIGGAIVAGYATLLVLNVLAPDHVVARVNVARATATTPVGGAPLDVAYLALLSGDAVPTTLSALLAPLPARGASASERSTMEVERCRAAERVQRRWGPASPTAAHAEQPTAWRRWNAGDARALKLVAASAAALRAVQHGSCAAARLSGVVVPTRPYR